MYVLVRCEIGFGILAKLTHSKVRSHESQVILVRNGGHLSRFDYMYGGVYEYGDEEYQVIHRD